MPILIAALILTIKTDGGFAGRGLGQLAINGEKVTTERCEGKLSRAECDQLATAIAAAKRLKWRDSYGHANPDAVEWTLELDDRKASWYDGNDVPKEIQALRDEAWKVRARVIDACR
jgi:hypothetical protein